MKTRRLRRGGNHQRGRDSGGACRHNAQDMGAGAMNRSPPYNFQGGEAVFKNICQGCHMANAEGAVGASMYPALAKNAKLEVAGYPVAVIVHGQKAMPPFGTATSQRPADRRCGEFLASGPISAQQLQGQGDTRGRQGTAVIESSAGE